MKLNKYATTSDTGCLPSVPALSDGMVVSTRSWRSAAVMPFQLARNALPVMLQSDAWLLGELLRNLLSNAVHHSPVAGELGIVLRYLRDEVELIVWDRGGGVEESVKQRLFEPFAASKGGTGIGLGLSICRQIALALSAQVDLFNRVELGQVSGVDAVVRWPRALSLGPVQS